MLRAMVTTTAICGVLHVFSGSVQAQHPAAVKELPKQTTGAKLPSAGAEPDPYLAPPRKEPQPAVPSFAPEWEVVRSQLDAMSKAIIAEDVEAFRLATQATSLLNFALYAESPSAIQLIAIRCRLECLALFRVARQRGARLNALAIDGTTPRHWAVISGNDAAVAALNALTVSSVPDVWGFTAEYFATREDRGYHLYTNCRSFRNGIAVQKRKWRDAEARRNYAREIMEIYREGGDPSTALRRALVSEEFYLDARQTAKYARIALDQAGPHRAKLLRVFVHTLRWANFDAFANALELGGGN